MVTLDMFTIQNERNTSYYSTSAGSSTKFPFNDVRFISFAISAASLGLQVIQLVACGAKAALKRRRASSEGDSEVETQSTCTGRLEKFKDHIASFGSSTIYGFMVARFVGSAVLLYFSTRTLQKNCNTDSIVKCPEAFLTITFLYSTFLGLVSVLSKTCRTSTTRHNIVILLSVFSVYLYRDIWPLATYDQQPADAEEGGLLIVKISVLAFVAAVIPLVIPRPYIPVNPKNPAPIPNPEQTASILSLMTFSFLDTIIFNGAKVAHLSFEQLPPLADYDSAKYMTEKAFPHVDVFAGARPRPLFYRIMRVFIKEYAGMLLLVLLYSIGGFISPIGIYNVLKHLETGGEGQSIKPWVWVIWLFLGPMMQSVFFQWYIYVANHTLALAELLIIELVFEHSLRIRFKAETSNDAVASRASRASTPASSRPETPAGSSASEDSPGSTFGVESENVTLTESTAEDSTAVRNSSTPTSISKSKSAIKPTASLPTSSTLPSNEQLAKKSDGNLVGKIINLVTVDINNITGARDFLWLIIGVPLNVGLCLAFLYRLLGWSTFAGFAVMLALLPIPAYIAKKIQQAQAERMKLTDSRVQAVSETMGIIRMVKLFGWENKMLDRLKGKRDEELKVIWRIILLDCASDMVGYIFPTFTIAVTYAVFTLVMKKELTSSIIFPTMAVFSMLRNQVFRLMQMTARLLQGKVSLDRLNEFLSKTELLDTYLAKPDSALPLAISLPEGELSNDIGFRNATFSWSSDEQEETETAISSDSRVYKLRIEGELLFKRNAINLIIGPTGSGKTSILMALLGEMHFIASSPDSWFNLPRSGGIAYAAQESWVQNDTIRNNILFGSEYDEERYQKVIKQCALEHDLELFNAADATEVGERGLTLSGGQKARITLARAIYSPAEILLLDDVFAALDVHTSTWIVNNCLQGDLIKNRTVLLVTHNVALASPVADFVVSVDTDGRIKSQGTQVSVALSRDPKFASQATRNEEVTVIEAETLDESPQKPPKADGKLIVAEELEEGHVTWKAWKLMLTSLGGDHPIFFFSIVMTTLLLNEWIFSYQVWFIGSWGSRYEHQPASEVPVYLYLLGYIGIFFIFCTFFTTSYLGIMRGSIRASRVINAKLIDSILGSTMRWLDETPVGRIITRCTQDIRAIDGPIPSDLFWLTDCASGVVAKLGCIVYFTPIFFWPGFTVTIAGLLLGNLYLKAQLSVKRETSNARAPMISHFTAAIHGLVSIRAYGAQNKIKAESLLHINHYTRVSRISYNLNQWIGFRIDFLGAVFTAALGSYLVYGTRVGTSNTGFSLNMALDFTNLILFTVKIYNSLEVEANSLERIQGYIDIEHEPKPTQEGKPPASWPTSGELRVENLSARYSRTGPKILHNISFTIASGERFGVVGRTGSGKSSLTLALLKCIITEGEVYLDGRPTSQINLDALRTSITIIPQSPELLRATLRENLDPFDQHDDVALNAALQSAGLFSLQEDTGEASLKLDTKIASGGGNLSVGQRQIIALARAIIRGSKLLILDEATSAIDYKTDSVIQHTLRTQLPKDVTVLTIAHRLQTIMDSDRIMVLEKGRIVEFGDPVDLLKNEKGLLRALVDESDDKEKLYNLVEQGY